MNIWVVMSGEPLPMLGERPHRIGILSEYLASKGHKVTWWTTTFDHQMKKHLFSNTKKDVVSKNRTMVYLHTKIKYKKNISVWRILNHYFVGKEFRVISRQETTPDIIFCAYPTIDLAFESVKYGVEKKIPVVIDVRDLWPDIFWTSINDRFKPMAKFLLQKLIFKKQFIFNNCNAITAISDGYLKWAKEQLREPNLTIGKVFPLGYKKNPVKYSPDERDEVLVKLGVDKSKKIIWFVGSFGSTYDLEPVILAARELDYRSDIQFVFSGDGQKNKIWKSLAKGCSNILFTGWLDKKGISILSEVTCVGLMAYAKGAPQGMPNKIFEYLSAGIPILSSLQTETKNILSSYNVGLTYDVEDYRDFIKKLEFIIDVDAERAIMSQNAISLFDKEYSEDVIYSKLSVFLESFAIGS